MYYNIDNKAEANFGVNASLLSNNSFFNLVRYEKFLYLIHVTKNSELIEKDGYIYPSSGCLLGSVYFTPGYFEKENNRIRLHNLGRYYFECESPNVISNRGLAGSPSIYIIKIDCRKGRPNILPINYLKFGQMHFDIYNELSYLLTKHEKVKLEKVVNDKLIKSLPFLKKIKKITAERNKNKKLLFINDLISNVSNLPILGYIYFEALNKTLMLHQSDEMSKKYYKKGEFYNWHYKNMMLHFYPDFFSKFNLGTFALPLDDVIEYIKNNNLVDNIEKFKFDLFDNIIQLLNDALSFEGMLDNFDIKDIDKTFVRTASYYYPLIGHIIHRELRNFKRYPDFYFYFDQVKALNIWNYWNKMNILILYNSIIPKGEIGLNPAYLDNLPYEVYEGIDYEIVDDYAYIKIGEKKNIKIAKKLIENKHGLMRNYMLNK